MAAWIWIWAQPTAREPELLVQEGAGQALGIGGWGRKLESGRHPLVVSRLWWALIQVSTLPVESPV